MSDEQKEPEQPMQATVKPDGSVDVRDANGTSVGGSGKLTAHLTIVDHPEYREGTQPPPEPPPAE